MEVHRGTKPSSEVRHHAGYPVVYYSQLTTYPHALFYYVLYLQNFGQTEGSIPADWIFLNPIPWSGWWNDGSSWICSVIWMLGGWSKDTVPWSGWWDDKFPNILFPDLNNGMTIFPEPCSLNWRWDDGFPSILLPNLDGGTKVFSVSCSLIWTAGQWFSQYPVP